MFPLLRQVPGVAAAVVVGLLGLAGPAAGQAAFGTLDGVVRDTSGGVLPAAAIDVRHLETNLSRATTTDAAGRFHLALLPVGEYEVRVAYPGFASHVRQGVVLAVGQTVRLPIDLSPASVTDEVTVRPAAPLLDVTQTSVTTAIDTERIEELPVRSRDYLQFALLAPGVASAPARASVPGAAPAGDSGFTFGGIRPRDNRLFIDGLENDDAFSGGSRTELSLESVREFQVVTNGYSAENGGSSGGAINVITKTGANIHHGAVFGFGQDGRLNARPFFEEAGDAAPGLRRLRAGAGLGGPLIRDRSFYYVAGEREDLRAQEASDIAAADIAVIDRVVAGPAYANSGAHALRAGLFRTSRQETEASGKIVHRVSGRHSLMARHAFTRNREAGDAFNTGGLTDWSGRGTADITDHALVGSLVSVAGSRTTNDLRWQWSTRHADLSANQSQGAEILVPGTADFGHPYAGASHRRERHLDAADTVTFGFGRHVMKAGGSLEHIQLVSVSQDGFGGLYLFRDLADLEAGCPDSFRQVVGSPGASLATTRLGAFAQDRWTPSGHLTVDAGVRFDADLLSLLPSRARHLLSPRIGATWSSGAWLARAGFRTFYGREALANLERAARLDGVNAFELVADDGTAAEVLAAAAGGSLAAPVAALRPSVYRVDPAMAPSSSRQVSVGVERALSTNLSAAAHYISVRGRHLARTRNINLGTPEILAAANAATLGVADPAPQQLGRWVYSPSRIDPRFDDIYQVEHSGSSSYHGVALSLTRRLAHELEWSASYTYSRARDDASDFDEHPEDPRAAGRDRSWSRYDQRHRLVVSALFDLPIGEEEDRTPPSGPLTLFERILSRIEVAPILTIESGRPQNALTGADENHSHAFPLSSRPLGAGRNGLRTPAFAAFDLRLLKYFPVGPHGRLDLVVEGFNLLNRANVSELDVFHGAGRDPRPGFGRAIGGFNARQIQFSIDLEF